MPGVEVHCRYGLFDGAFVGAFDGGPLSGSVGLFVGAFVGAFDGSGVANTSIRLMIKITMMNQLTESAAIFCDSGG